VALKPQILVDPFEKWVMDFVGIGILPYQKKVYILLCIEYVAKWVEVKALTEVTKKVGDDFLYEYIFFRFGVPCKIVMDQGT